MDLSSTCTPIRNLSELLNANKSGLYMYYLIYNVFQCLILPSSWLLCQIGGSTCTPLQIELLKLKLSKHEGPG